MPPLNFGEWRPDVSDYEATTSRNIQNVVPRGDGYGPFPSPDRAVAVARRAVRKMAGVVAGHGFAPAAANG